METENLFGTIIKPLKDNGETEKRTGMASGNLQKGITMKDNGNRIVNLEKDIIIIMEARNLEAIL